MADGGSIKIRIEAEDSGVQSALRGVERSAKSATAALAQEYKKAGQSWSDAMKRAAAEVKRAQQDGTTVVINGTETIIRANRRIAAQKDELGDTYDELTEGAQAAARAVDDMSDSAGRGMRALADGRVKVRAGLADIKAGFDMAAAAARAVADVAGEGIGYNAEIEQMQVSFETMTGSAEKARQIVADLRTMGAETPFETTDLTQTVNLLMQYGLGADDAMAKMRMLGDISQGNADKMMRIATAYGQMSSAGKVQLEDVKQMIEAGYSPLQQIAETTGESMESLYKRISAGTLSVQEITQAMVDATSEGGKYFQSMEKQSQTLNGQLSTLKDNANQLLGTLTSGMAEELRTELAPLANEMIGALQRAYESGGTEGLMRAANAMLPDLLNMMTGGLESALGAAAKWLPGGAEGLMKALPGALRGASGVIPQLTTALFGVASEVVSGLIGMLPELVPALAEGIVNLLGAAMRGIDQLAAGLFDGVGALLKRAGVLKKGLNDVISEAFEGADTDFDVPDVEVAPVNVNGEVDASAYVAEIEAAKEAIRGAINGLSLSEADADALEAAIMRGSGAEALRIALEQLDVPEAQAAATAQKISDAMDTIRGTLESLDLSAETREKILTYVAAGGDVQTALETFAGLSPEEAQAKAAELQPALDDVTREINALKLAGVDVSALLEGCAGANGQIVAALKLLGVDDAEIAAAISGMQTLSSSVATQVGLMFEELKAAFTNGVGSDDAGAASEAQAAMQSYTGEVESQIDAWAAEAKAQLSAMGLDAETLSTRIGEIDAQAAAMKATLDAANAGTQQWIAENAGAATAVVQEHVDELDGILTTVEDLEARIQTLRAGLNPTAYATRNAVERGVVSNKSLQAEAIQLTFKEREAAELAAIEEYDAASRAAADKLAAAEKQKAQAYADADAAYAAAIEDGADNAAATQRRAEAYSEADAAYAAAQEKAAQDAQAAEAALTAAEAQYNAAYEAHMQRILQGILMSNEDFARAMGENAQLYQSQNIAGDLLNAIIANVGNADVTLADILSSLNISQGDLDGVAAALGVEPGVLTDALERALGEASGLDAQNFLDTFLNGNDANQNFSEFASGAEYTLTKALEGVDLSDAAGVLQNALDEGWLTGTENLDWTEPEAELQAAIERFIAEGGQVELPPAWPKIGLEPEVSADGAEIGQQAASAVETAAGAEEVAANVTVPLEADVALQADAEGADPAAQVQAAIEDEASGETVVISQSAQVNLNVTAEVSGTDFNAAGAAAAGQFAEGIAAGDGAAKGAAAGLGTAAISGARTATSSASTLGKNFSQGLAGGISSGRSSVINAATRVARAAANAVRNILGIHSPSRVAWEMGDYFGKGFDIGLEKSMQRAVDTARRLSGEIVTAADLTQSVRVNVPDLRQEIVIANQESSAPVLLDGHEIARIQAGNNSQSLAWKNTRAAKGVGSR